MGDSPRRSDAPGPAASRGDARESGVEQSQGAGSDSTGTSDMRSSEEGGQPDSGGTADVEGADLGGVE